MVALLIAVGALFIAVVGRALLDPWPSVPARGQPIQLTSSLAWIEADVRQALDLNRRDRQEIARRLKQLLVYENTEWKSAGKQGEPRRFKPLARWCTNIRTLTVIRADKRRIA